MYNTHLCALQCVSFVHFFKSKLCTLPCFFAPQLVLQFPPNFSSFTWSAKICRQPSPCPIFSNMSSAFSVPSSLQYVASLLRTQFSPILPSPPFPWCPDIPSALFAVCKHCRSTLVLLPFSLSEFYYESLINTSNNGRPVGVVAW